MASAPTTPKPEGHPPTADSAMIVGFGSSSPHHPNATPKPDPRWTGLLSTLYPTSHPLSLYLPWFPCLTHPHQHPPKKTQQDSAEAMLCAL